MSGRYSDRYSRSPREEKTPEGKPKGSDRKTPEASGVACRSGFYGELSKPSRLGDARVLLDLDERIRSKINVTPDGGCWIWTASLTKSGYGQVWHDGTMRRAHRVIYEALGHPIPSHLECDHICEVRNCVNPDHIALMTHAHNMALRWGRHGHEREAHGERIRAHHRRRVIEAGGWVAI